MKKLSVLFFSLFAVATITSCSNDDDKSASIEGKWEISKEGETLETLKAANNNGGCGFENIELLKGGTFKHTDFEYYNSECETYTGKGTWSRKDKILTVKNDGENDITEYEIIELTDSTLKLKETDEEGVWYSVHIKK